MNEIRTIKLDKYDHKLLLIALNEFRNMKIKENANIKIIDDLLMKLYKAPVKVKGEHYER